MLSSSLPRRPRHPRNVSSASSRACQMPASALSNAATAWLMPRSCSGVSGSASSVGGAPAAAAGPMRSTTTLRYLMGSTR